MATSVAKTYAGALFSLVEEESGARSQALTTTLSELKLVSDIAAAEPDFVRLMRSPAVTKEEKAGVLSKAFDGRISRYSLNFLRLLADKNRFSQFGEIFRDFSRRYNDAFGIAEITVTTPFALTDDTREKITAKMAKVTGKDIRVKEIVDRAVIGGIVIDYGSTRFDGSVRTRLEALRQDIAGIII